MNLMQIKNKTTLIEEKTRQLIQKMKQMEFQNETEMLQYLINAIRNFYLNLDSPNMQLRYAGGPPMSSVFNDTIKEISQDIGTLFKETDAVTSALGEMFEQVTLEQAMLGNLAKGLEDKLKKVSQKLNQEAFQVTFSDSFINQDHFDTAMVKTAPASILGGVGILALGALDAVAVEEATIRILDSSNGFPGNTHQVKTVNNSIKFYGEENLHINLAEIFDGNADTWFEYEIYDVPDSVRESLGNFGFRYKEPVSWYKESDTVPLRLAIEIELPTVTNLNFLSLTPYLPDQRGVSSPSIKNISVADGAGGVRIVSNGEKFDKDKVYMFSQLKVKKIWLTLEQSLGYDAEIGHFYFKETTSSMLSYLTKNNYQTGKRVDGPNPSVKCLGLKYDDSTDALVQPETKIGEATKLPNYNSELFNVPTSSDPNIQAGLETITAKRFHIGIRDMLAANFSFKETSEYVSEKWTVDSPFESVKLSVRTQIPEEFPRGTYIEYYITPDEGKTWYPIAPEDTTAPDTKTLYLINSNIPDEGREDYIGYIDTIEPVTSLRLKIVLSRPTSILYADYYTPVVYEYTLKGTVENEVA